MLPRFTIVALAMLMLVACGGATEQAAPTSSGQSLDTNPTVTATPETTPTALAATPTIKPEAAATPTAAVAVELPETIWTLTSLNGETIDTAATITLSFRDSLASGQAGCNGYSGGYTANPEGDLSLGEIEQTAMECQEPAGIKDLEGAYMDALSDVERYRLTDTRLELANASSETTLIFTSGEQADLDGTFWSVVTLDGDLLIAKTYITIAFSKGQISGSAGCNAVFGQYTAGNDGSLSFTGIGSTAMECSEPEGIMDQEFALFDALQGIISYRLDAATSTLELVNAAGQTRIELLGSVEPTGGGFLDRTGWVLTDLNGQKHDPTTFPITLMIRDSQFSGESGCLVYYGYFTTDASGGISALNLDLTDAGCEGLGDDGNASVYLDTLATVTQSRVARDRLELLNANGETILVYRPGLSDSGLEGTEWTLLMLSGSDPIEGTTITLSFADQVGGVAGCNEYGGDYVVVEIGIISMPGVSHTDMGCLKQGIQEQETTYLDTLQQVGAYELTDTTLVLMKANGETLLVFERGID
ncbi:hypothetical protein BH24CHL1_BH24CHL1_13390 [soil metagenome]